MACCGLQCLRDDVDRRLRFLHIVAQFFGAGAEAFVPILDQGFIYLLIAGTYTPFALAYLRTGWWWLLFGMIWAFALCGCFSKSGKTFC